MLVSKFLYARTVACLALFLFLLVGCGADPAATDAALDETPTAATAVAEPILSEGKAYVDTIEILKSETMPLEISVVARGDLPDSCTQIEQVTQRRDDAYNTLWIDIITLRTSGADCVNSVVTFEEKIPLDVYALPAGTYAVNVNGASGMFLLAEDNVPPPQVGSAQVDSLQLLIEESFPVQVSAQVKGNLPDACATIAEIRQNTDLEQRLLQVEITTQRAQDAACAQTLVPFEQVIPLAVEDLAAGVYTVAVNGVTQTLTLEADNMPLEDDQGADLVVEKVRLSGMNIQVTGMSPVQASVTVRGKLLDDCSEVGPINQRVDADTWTIWVEVNVSHPRDAVCNDSLTEFSESFDLDIAGLPAGTYSVDVNGIPGSVVLGVSNTP